MKLLSAGKATARNFDQYRDWDFALKVGEDFARAVDVDFLPPTRKGVEAILGAPNTIIGIAEVEGAQVGALGFQFVPYMWNPDIIVASELFFWVYPEHSRSGAAVALTKWAKIALLASGADVETWSSVPTSPESLHRYYRRRGLRPLSMGYWGAL